MPRLKNKPIPTKNHAGITLAETLVSLILFTFLLAGLITTLQTGGRSWETFNASVQAQREARLAVQNFSRDLRMADLVFFTDNTSTDVNFLFTHPADGNVTYIWTSNAGSTANQLLRQTTTETRIIAQNIATLIVTDQSDDITLNVTSTVTGDKGESSSFNLIKKIAKR